MERQIYRVDAWTIDSTGTYHGVTGYPKNFDSKDYPNADKPTEVAFKRADGDASGVWSDMCKNDQRQMQVVVLSTIDGQQVYRKCTGKLAEITPAS